MQEFLQEKMTEIKEALENGVKKMVVVGYDLQTSLKAVEFASNFDFIYAAVGIHPSEVKKTKLRMHLLS